jgi:hypothetical protein
LLSLVCVATAILPCGTVASAASNRDVLYISSAEDLIAFSEAVNSGDKFKGRLVIQTADIDLNNVPFTPIGIFKSGNYFFGMYDGGGHSISNLVINCEEGEQNNGLFGQLGGMVMNLGIESGAISGYCCGSIASHAAASTACVINCYSKAMVTGKRAGGIVDNFMGSVVNCWYDNSETVLPVCGYTARCIVHCYTNGEVYGESFKGYHGNCSSTKDIALDQSFCNKMNSYLGRTYYYLDLSGEYRLNKYICEEDGNIRFGEETVKKPGVFSKAFIVEKINYIFFGAIAVLAVSGIVLFLIFNRKREVRP